MLKAFKYRIFPTKIQIQLIEKHFGSTRFLYNYFLDYRQKEFEWLNECGSQSLQMALRELDNSY